jgi:hypothetical protein
MTEAEAKIDKIFDTVKSGRNFADRVAAMHEIDEILAQQQFYIHTYTNILFVAGRNDIGNFKPALMENCAYWNGYMLYRGEKGPPAGGVPESAPVAPAAAATNASAAAVPTAAPRSAAGK